MWPSDNELIDVLVRRIGDGAALEHVRRTLLPGGYVSSCVERIDLTLSNPDRGRFVAAFVRKTCPAREARALELLAGVEGADARPELLASWISADQPDDVDASTIVTPFYPGATLHFGEPIPAPVLVTLARLHAATSDPASHGWAPPFDAARIDWLAAEASDRLAASETFKADAPDHADWLARLRRAAAEPRLRQVAETLPRALVHGDIHPANIVLDGDGSPIILDWGNVAAAPPMLDLANIIEIDSPDWRLYLDAYRMAGGAIDGPTSRRAYHWARAATALGYVPWAADGHSSHVPRLIAQIETTNVELAAFG